MDTARLAKRLQSDTRHLLPTAASDTERLRSGSGFESLEFLLFWHVCIPVLLHVGIRFVEHVDWQKLAPRLTAIHRAQRGLIGSPSIDPQLAKQTIDQANAVASDFDKALSRKPASIRNEDTLAAEVVLAELLGELGLSTAAASSRAHELVHTLVASLKRHHQNAHATDAVQPSFTEIESSPDKRRTD